MRSWTLAAWVMLLVCAALGLVHSQAKGAEVLKPTHLSFEAYEIERNYDSYLPTISDYSHDPEYWSHGAAVNWDVNLLKIDDWTWYWRNTNHMSSTNAQVRYVGWQWDLGIGWRDKIEGFYWHHSQHALDMEGEGAYPLIDRYGVRFIFIP